MLGWFSRKIKAGLAKTKGVFTGVFDLLRGKGKVDQAFLDELEKRLYLADVGTQATAVIVDRVRQASATRRSRGRLKRSSGSNCATSLRLRHPESSGPLPAPRS
jgi:fused signal recognition particle receptor